LIHPAARWLFDRLGLQPVAAFIREHKVPPALGTWRGWMYVFGLSTAAAFGIQVVTGIGLATIYVPSAAQAYQTLEYITEEAPFGALLRALHFYGASAMVVLVLLHMARVYLTASYQSPREMNWMTGVLLLVLTFLMALTGQLLRWDQDGLWTVVVASKFAERVPIVGEWVAAFILAGPTVGGATLTRFYALHVIVLPLIIVGLIGVHVYLVIVHGVSEPPGRARGVPRSEYRDWYHRLKERHGVRYWPDAWWREMVAVLVVVCLVTGLALVFGPKGPGPPPDPTVAFADPRPDWFLRWYYALLWIKPRGLESFVMVYAPILLILLLLALPLLAGYGDRRLSRRPWAVGIAGGAAIVFVTLTAIGLTVPWTPEYDTQPVDTAILADPAPDVVEGARVFHDRGCQVCHVVLGEGGTFGPDLTRIADRIPPEEISVRIMRGFGDMPAYHGVLDAVELNRILAFLRAVAAHENPQR
jgi:ubiquinol-cytochrome c reductase cytochrome b subunit